MTAVAVLTRGMAFREAVRVGSAVRRNCPGLQMSEESCAYEAGALSFAGVGFDGHRGKAETVPVLPLALSLLVHAVLALLLFGETLRAVPPRLGDTSPLSLQVVWVSAPSAPSAEKLDPTRSQAETAVPPVSSTAAFQAVPTHENAPSRTGPEAPSARTEPAPSATPLSGLASGRASAAEPAPASGGSGTHNPAIIDLPPVAPAATGSSSLTPPRYRIREVPVYPAAARLRGYEGLVLIAAQVSSQGRVQAVRIKKSSGYALLDRSAEAAVKTWRFEPGRQMGTPMTMWVDVPVRFVLGDAPSSSDS